MLILILRWFEAQRCLKCANALLALGTEVEDDLWSFASEHKDNPRLCSQLELYEKRKTLELKVTVSMAEVELDSIPNPEQPQQTALDTPPLLWRIPHQRNEKAKINKNGDLFSFQPK